MLLLSTNYSARNPTSPAEKLHHQNRLPTVVLANHPAHGFKKNFDIKLDGFYLEFNQLVNYYANLRRSNPIAREIFRLLTE